VIAGLEYSASIFINTIADSELLPAKYRTDQREIDHSRTSLFRFGIQIGYAWRKSDSISKMTEAQTLPWRAEDLDHDGNFVVTIGGSEVRIPINCGIFSLYSQTFKRLLAIKTSDGSNFPLSFTGNLQSVKSWVDACQGAEWQPLAENATEILKLCTDWETLRVQDQVLTFMAAYHKPEDVFRFLTFCLEVGVPVNEFELPLAEKLPSYLPLAGFEKLPVSFLNRVLRFRKWEASGPVYAFLQRVIQAQGTVASLLYTHLDQSTISAVQLAELRASGVILSFLGEAIAIQLFRHKKQYEKVDKELKEIETEFPDLFSPVH
jgi:hypothetical protein